MIMNFIKEGKWAKVNRINELINEYCPDGVEIRCLEYCCYLLDKKRKPITKASREAGEYPYYGANGIQDYVANYIFDGTFVLVGEDGSVITKSGTPVVTWAEGKIWVNNHAHIIEEKDDVMLRYLYHYLQTIDVTSLSHGNIPKSVSYTHLDVYKRQARDFSAKTARTSSSFSSGFLSSLAAGFVAGSSSVVPLNCSANQLAASLIAAAALRSSSMVIALSLIHIYGNISTFRSDWREIEYRRIAVGFRLWIRCQRLWHQDCCLLYTSLCFMRRCDSIILRI